MPTKLYYTYTSSNPYSHTFWLSPTGHILSMQQKVIVDKVLNGKIVTNYGAADEGLARTR